MGEDFILDLIILPETDEKLLEECDFDTFRSSGKGGQHVNTTNSAVRLIHRPTGITITSQQERSQHQNKAVCLEKLRAKVARLNYRAPKRIPKKIPASAKRRIQELKQRTSEKKQLRSKPGIDNE